MVQAGDAPAKGRSADVIAAARTAYDAALRLIKPGKKVADVAPVLNKIVESYGCQLVEGVMSHQMKQYVIDGNKCVLNKPNPEAKVEDQEFLENEVYAVDIVVSSGEGKTKVMDEKETTVYKRALDAAYSLKLKASRAVCSAIDRNFPAMPFTVRALIEAVEKDEKSKDLSKQLRLGMVECLNHGLLHPYPVLHEKTGEVVAQVKGTVLLMPNGSDVVTKVAVPAVESDKKVDDQEVLDILAQPLKRNKKAEKKAAKKAAAGNA